MVLACRALQEDGGPTQLQEGSTGAACVEQGLDSSHTLRGAGGSALGCAGAPAGLEEDGCAFAVSGMPAEGRCVRVCEGADRQGGG
jgi:hypothetical protein